MSIAVDALAAAPLGSVSVATEPIIKVPPKRRMAAKADGATAPEPR